MTDHLDGAPLDLEPEDPDDVQDLDADDAPEPPDPDLSDHRGLGWLLSFRVSARDALFASAVLLIILLVALVAYLVLSLGASTSIVQRGGPAVARIQPLLTIDGPGTGKSPRLSRPMGVAFGPDGRIYVTDTGNNRVCVFGADGKFQLEFGSFGVAKPLPGAKDTWKPGRMNYPIGIDVDSNGTVYIADFRNDQVQAYTSGGKFLRSFPDPRKVTGRGSSGQDGTGIAVTDVAVRDGKVYATDTFQIFVFDTEGKLLSQFGKPGAGPGDLDHPNGVAVDGRGRVYVSDSNHARVLAFDPDRRLKWAVGNIPAGMNDTTSSPLALPRGLAVADDGSIYVADAFSFEIVQISAEGLIVQRFGERGVDPGQMNFPNDVDVSGDRLLIADKENNRVEVVRLVR
ncbi:MAG TPA: 6-bladed beta-propeller [Coriobacteriia bacterium]